MLEENESLPAKNIDKDNSREHLANERTLLAWIRTCIGIMAFGFVVMKFSLFIKQISLLLDKNVPTVQHGYSSIIGIFIVIVGAVMLVLSYIKYKKTEKQLLTQSFKPSSTLVFSLIVIILFISILLIVYLVENTRRY